MNNEENDRSETGGDDYMDENMLREKRAGDMDLGGGTGSSMNFETRSGKGQPQSSTNKPIRSYMEGSQLDDNMSVADRKRKQAQLEKAMPAEGKSKACADCTIF